MFEDINVESFVARQVDYWNTYPNQYNWKAYNGSTVLNDALYGLGASISEEYKFAGGYDRFKRELYEFLKGELNE